MEKVFNIGLKIWWKGGYETHISHKAIKSILTVLEDNSILYNIELLEYKKEDKLLLLTFSISNYDIQLNKIKYILQRNNLFVDCFTVNSEQKNINEAFRDIFLAMDAFELSLDDWKYKSVVGLDKTIDLIKSEKGLIHMYKSYYNFDGELTEKEDGGNISFETAKNLMDEFPDWNISHPY